MYFFTTSKQKSVPRRGFSLVETLVAVSILLIAVLAPMRIVAQSIKASVTSREQLIAVFLAQEGIEAMTRLRDNDYLDGGPTWSWYSGLPGACTNGTGCDYDVDSDSFTPCSGSNCLMYIDENGGGNVFYSHDSGDTPTQFTRKIFVSEPTSGEAEITSTVSWYSDVAKENVDVSLQTRVFDQYQ